MDISNTSEKSSHENSLLNLEKMVDALHHGRRFYIQKGRFIELGPMDQFFESDVRDHDIKTMRWITKELKNSLHVLNKFQRFAEVGKLFNEKVLREYWFWQRSSLFDSSRQELQRLYTMNPIPWNEPGGITQELITFLLPRINKGKLSIKDFEIKNNDDLTKFLINFPIKKLDLSGISVDDFLLSNEAIISLTISPLLANLEQLNLTDCPKPTAVLAFVTSPNLQNLEYLNLSGCHRINDVVNIIANSPYLIKLEKLNLSNCQNLSDDAVMAIANSPYFTNLQQLNLSFCQNLTNEAVNSIANSSQIDNLEELNIGDCPNLTNDAVNAIANSPNLVNLKQLNLRNCSRLTDEALDVIATSPDLLMDLQQLVLSNCPNISKKALDALKLARPSLKIIV